jgi:hypothetical protein
MRWLTVAAVFTACGSADLEHRVEALEKDREREFARSAAIQDRPWYCVYVGPGEPVLVASCYRTVDECAAGHVSKKGSCITAPFAWCTGDARGEVCFFEREYCDRHREMIRADRVCERTSR